MKIVLKIHLLYKNLVGKAYIEISKSRGMKVGENVIFIEVPAFGYLERLHYRKGYKKSMKAPKNLLNHGFPNQIIIIDNGKNHTYLSNRAEELKVQDAFRLVGTLSYPFTKNTDFYKIPSESKDWPPYYCRNINFAKTDHCNKCGNNSGIYYTQKKWLSD